MMRGVGADGAGLQLQRGAWGPQPDPLAAPEHAEHAVVPVVVDVRAAALEAEPQVGAEFARLRGAGLASAGAAAGRDNERKEEAAGAREEAAAAAKDRHAGARRRANQGAAEEEEDCGSAVSVFVLSLLLSSSLRVFFESFLFLFSYFSFSFLFSF